MYPTENMLDAKAELAQLNALRERLVLGLAPLYGKYKTTKEYAQGLYEFIAQSKIQQKLKSFEQRFAEAGDPVREREYAQIYRLVMDLLDQIVSLVGEEETTAEEFAKLLEAGFEELQVGTIPQNVDRVVAGDMERTRLKQVKALFFAGVNDGNIPGNAGNGGIISDLDREFLTGSGQELAPSPRQQMYIQRFYLYLNMTKPSELLVLSWAPDESGRKGAAKELSGGSGGSGWISDDSDGKAGAGAHAFTGAVFFGWTGISCEWT